METIEAVVGEGGVLHVENLPLETGTLVKVVYDPKPVGVGKDEWSVRLLVAREAFNKMDFKEPDPSIPTPSSRSR